MTIDQQAESSPELLNQVVRLLGILVIEAMPEGSTLTDKILLLHSAGLPSAAIAEITGAALQTVANRISEAKSASKKDKNAKDA